MMAREHLGEVLGRLCPLHALLDEAGHVTHAGPTLQKLRPDLAMPGRRFLELFELARPRAVDTMAGLVAAAAAGARAARGRHLEPLGGLAPARRHVSVT